MASYGSWEGAHHAAEIILEALMDVQYELRGPEGYNSDYKKQLKEDGDWDAEVSRWQGPSEEDAVRLEAAENTLLWCINACNHAAIVMADRVAKSIGSYPSMYKYWPGKRLERFPMHLLVEDSE